MRIPLDRQRVTPLYRQIEAFFRQAILDGNLLPDTRLPAIRRLARDLGVNRITVESAYAGLEADGLITARVGSGTYVLPPYPLACSTSEMPMGPWPRWQQALPTVPDRDEAFSEQSATLLAASGHPQPIDFSAGVGAEHLFPSEDFRKTIQRVMRRDAVASLTYGDRRGYAPLRNTIAQVLASQGLRTHADNLLITAGSQQAIALVSLLLLKPGDTVLVESPTYQGALDLFRSLDLRIIGVPMDADGMRVESLEEPLQRYHPRLIYTIPNFHNPTGTCLSSPRRRQLIALADRYDVPILEDDFVGDLRYDGRAQPALKALDPGGRVIYISTFSKMLMPGVRVGFLVAEGPVYEHLVHYKRVNDLATSNLMQRALEAYVTVGRYQSHLRRTCHHYRRRREAMLQAIADYLPETVQVEPPQGGLFIWLRLPEQYSATDLLLLACQQGVAFAPGNVFFPEASRGQRNLRLNFAVHPPEVIADGIGRLGRALALAG